MDISVIHSESVNDVNGIKIGPDDAPKKLIEFTNLRCPYCKKWFEESEALLENAIAQGKVQLIIKLLDKDKPILQRGNVMHRYISSEPLQAQKQIQQIFATQEEWGNLALEEVAEYAEKVLGLHPQDTHSLATEIRNEAERANIKFVPTLLIGPHIFDESISEEKLKEYLEL